MLQYINRRVLPSPKGSQPILEYLKKLFNLKDALELWYELCTSFLPVIALAKLSNFYLEMDYFSSSPVSCLM